MPLSERRQHKRVELHCPVRLLRQPGTQSVESVTENLSSDGFYCVSREPLQPGERLKGVIVICGGTPPAYEAPLRNSSAIGRQRCTLGDSASAVRLECHVTVMRVEGLYSAFGLGCH